jgi:hypothetical protein
VDGGLFEQRLPDCLPPLFDQFALVQWIPIEPCRFQPLLTIRSQPVQPVQDALKPKPLS